MKFRTAHHLIKRSLPLFTGFMVLLSAWAAVLPDAIAKPSLIPYGSPPGGSSYEQGQLLAQIILPTQPKLILTPSPTPKIIIAPTIKLPTIVIPPTNTPTPVPIFDLGVSGVVVDTTAIVHSIEGMDVLQGSYSISVKNAPVEAIPVNIQYNLLDYKGVSRKSWRDAKTISNKFRLSSYTASVQFSEKAATTDALPLSTYSLSIQISVGESKDPLIDAALTGDNIDPDQTNNKASSSAQKILHLSGTLVFGNIATTITSLSNYNFSPIKISGTGSWNSAIPFSFTDLTVGRNNVTLVAVVSSGSAAFEPPSNPYTPTASRWSYQYANGVLNASGAFADLGAVLPDGAAWRKAGVSEISFSEEPLNLNNQKLTQTLQMASAEATIADPLIWMNEGIPIMAAGNGQTFSPVKGITLIDPTPIYRFAPHFNAGFGPGKRPTNDGYLSGNIKFVNDVLITERGMQAAASSDSAEYLSSFPYNAKTRFQNLNFTVVNGHIQTNASDIQIADVVMNASTGQCQSTEPITALFNAKGSIDSDGAVVVDAALVNEYYPRFNTYTFDPISAAVWYQPGYVLPKGGATDDGVNIAEYLQAMRERGKERLYSYGDVRFSKGSDLFAGLNVMPDALLGQNFKVEIDGNPLELTNTEWTKFYIRPVGFTGVVDAQSSTNKVEIYNDPECDGQGYLVTITSFGQAYLDNDSEGLDSTIDGKIDIPWPSSITVPFEDMTLSGCGNFTQGKIPADAQSETKTLSYWQADLRLLTLAFDLLTDSSQDDERTLWVTSKNTIPHLGDEPSMQINIRPCGTLRESRIESPLLTTYDGFTTTAQKIYLTNWDGTHSPNGFYSIAGDLTVSFFNPPNIHAIVRGTVGELASGDPWADQDDPDGDREGFPSSFSSGESDISAKIADYVAKNPVTVQTQFANLINLEYTLSYNKTDKEFKSDEPLNHDLIVMDIISAVEYLNASKTEISFGVEVGGLPELNLSSAASEFSDEISNTFLEPVRDKLDEVAEKLTGDLTLLIRQQVESFIQPYIESMLNEMKDYLAQIDPSQYEAYLNDASFQNLLDDMFSSIDLSTYLRTDDLMPVVEEIQDIITKLRDVNDALHFDLDDLTADLGPLTQALLSMAFEYLQESIGYDIDDVLAPVQDAMAEIIAFLDEQVVPILEEAEAFFEDPTVYLDTYFKPADIAALETQIKDAIKAALLDKAETSYNNLMNISAEEVTDYLIDPLFNSQMFQDLNAAVTNYLYPVKEALLDQAQEVLDSINDAIEEFIKEKAELIDGVAAEIKDTIGFKGASMKGYAVVSGNTMEKLHIDAEFTIAIPDDVTYSAYLDMTRYQISNSGKNCYANLDAEDVMDVRIGAEDVGLSWVGAELTAELIEIKLMISGGSLVNVGGTLQTKGQLGFETMAIEDPSFGVGIGLVENYIWASCTVKFDAYQMSGGIFLGTCCSLEPLEIIDPEVASLLNTDEMRGVFLSVEGSFPILNYGCGLRVAAEGGVAMWYFADGPTYGGKLTAGAYGEAGCVVSVKGSLTLIGGKDGSQYYFNGSAWVAGGVGSCEPEDWDSPGDVLDDSWCLACVASFDITYKNGEWSADYDVDCG
ncbi:MAG: hypothetical protein AB1656_25310 [Candidatus Omnitrophota bacterium]